MLPQSEPPSLRILPAAWPKPLEHLNLNPVQAENVPIFCLKFDAFEDGWAEIGTFPPGLLKTIGLACFGGGYTRGASL